MTPSQLTAMSPQQWEAPRFAIGARVVHSDSGKAGFVQGHYGWNPPILKYAVVFEDGEHLDGWVSETELRAC